MSNENKINLLMVDDEVKFLESISKRLMLKNFDVTTAVTGQEAIKSAETGFFDVAVVDFQMPGMDGAQVLTAEIARPHEREEGHGDGVVDAEHHGVADRPLQAGP